MGNIEITIIVIISLIIIYNLWITYSDYKWHKKPINNFPFKYRGKEFWYSRSVAVTGLVFCKNSNNEICVLANKRGKGTPDFQGYWNLVCGYLDHNETTSEAVSREVLEETGLYIPSEKFEFFNYEDSPKANRQNVTFRFTTFLDGTCDDYIFSKDGSEENEVDEIKWINVNEIDNYNWAFNHCSLIKNVIETKNIQ